MDRRPAWLALSLLAAPCCAFAQTQCCAFAQTQPLAPVTHDGGHDFDFLIGDWRAHLRRLPDRLSGSTRWVEYDGTSKTHKLLGSNANFEEFEATSQDGKQHLKGQTLRLYNPEARQWSIFLLDVDQGSLGLPPVVGAFEGGKGEFIDQETWKGRSILVRYTWTDQGEKRAHMEQAFSADSGKTWETNWILDLTRASPG